MKSRRIRLVRCKGEQRTWRMVIPPRPQGEKGIVATMSTGTFLIGYVNPNCDRYWYPVKFLLTPTRPQVLIGANESDEDDDDGYWHPK